MDYGGFSWDKSMYHELTCGYALQSAPEREFGINYAVYRNVNPDFENFLEYGSDLEGLNYCFWILRRKEIVGGVIIRPNHIEGLFLKPPFTDRHEVLKAVLPILVSWSDRSMEIEACDVMPYELEFYQRFGYRIQRGRRCYIRPTETFDVSWEDSYELAIPGMEHLMDLAVLFHTAYSISYRGGLGKLGTQSLDEWLSRIEKYLKPENVAEICHCSSTLIYERNAEKLIGACIVRLGRCITQPAVPKVSDIAVHPDYQRRGLATKMLKKALTVLKSEYPTLRFGVAAGNPAESVYHSLGFLPGVTQYTLVNTSY